MIKRVQGFTLVELILFILVSSIIGAGIFLSFQQVLVGQSQSANRALAEQLAASRMEIILATRRLQGFSGLQDPCNQSPAPVICNTPTGFTVTSTLVPTIINGDNQYTTITINVLGRADTQLISQMGEY